MDLHKIPTHLIPKSAVKLFSLSLVLVVMFSSCAHRATSTSEITYKRTACFGTCPIYTLTVDGKGKAVFKGDRFTEKLGTFEKQLTKSETKELFALLLDTEWKSFNAEYPAMVSDLPSTIFHFKHRAIDKEVVVTGKHPEVLDRLGEVLSQIADSEGWVATQMD